MKKIKKLLVAVSATLIAGLSTGALVACGGGDGALQISFETNGAEKIEAITAEKGGAYTLPQPAAREGYEFGGWYDNAAFEGSPVTQITMGESNVTYYAKWTQLAKITLQLDGGSLDDSELYLKAGANVADFMQKYQPTKSGLIFGAWFDGENELSASKKMPADGLTLTAKYKVEYTVKLMLETVEGGEYEEKQVVNSDYVGKNITVAEAPEGFTEIAHDGANKTGVLSATSAENVFTQYFTRNSYTLTFRPNYPADTTGTDENITVAEKYGVAFDIPDEFSCAGYVLAGWALSANGEVAYKTNQIERLVFNTDGEAPAKASMEMLGKDASLYAVWKKGYTDMFGGADTIFFLDSAEEGTTKDIFLSRGGRFFRGTYHVRQEIFEFQMSDSKINGKLYDGDVFAYSSAKRDESWSALYDNGELKEDIRIDFGKYNEITYTQKDAAGFSQQSDGTYTIDKNGYYVAEFASGNMQGKSLTFIVGTVTADGKPRNAFQIRKDDEIDLGEIVGYKVSGKTVVADADAYTITLNGLGIATCKTSTTQASYYYSIEDGVITLTSRYGATILVARLTKADGKNVYFEYEESVDETFTFANGDSIALNGSHEAVYTVDGKEEKGLFTVVSTSVFGGFIVDVYVGEETYRMTVNTREEKVLEDGEIKPKYYYEAENKLENYSEYFYLNNGLVYYAPLLVLDAENAGEAKLYGLNNNTNEYILASKGEYKKMDGFDRYVYTASEWYDCEKASVDPFDLATLKVVVFNVDTKATSYSLSYWYSTANGDKDTTEESIDYSKTYTSAKEDDTSLVLVSGFAFYKDAKGLTYEGAYAVKDGIMTVFAGKDSYYLEIDEENKQFIALDYAPYNGYIVEEDGDISKEVYLAFDGKGNATYTVLTLDEDGEEVSRTEEIGVVTKTKLTTDYNREIWTFKSKNHDFNFIEVTQSSNSYIIPFNEKYNGEYQSQAGRLTLDGYVYGAKFVDAKKNEYEGSYFIIEENVVQMYAQDEDGNVTHLYFDLNGKSFTVRGEEYGEYLVTENQYGTYYVELNGYGKLSVYTKEEVEGQGKPNKTYIDENGTYTINGKTYEISYQMNGKTVKQTGEIGTAFTDDGVVSAFLVYNAQTVYTFVNESDWSMLLLDDFGRATKYDKEGLKEEGKFTVIDTDLIYYTSENQEASMIYSYDAEKGTIQRVEKLQLVGYYTQNLESLLFTEYGFAVFNGLQSYYYRVDSANDVWIYRQDPTAADANDYGFVLEKFGKFDQTKSWTLNGVEKDYVKNDGWTIKFSRSDGETTGEGDNAVTTYPYPVAINTKEKYPLTNLAFQPTDEAEFTVNGAVDYNGVSTSCTVTREIVDEKTGEAKMYVSLNGYAYRFYIDVNYNGSENTYKVVAMTLEREIPSYNFLYSYYVYALYYGQIIENDIGTIYIHGNYDEFGEKQDFYMTAEFLEGSEFKGVDDELLAFEKGTYELNGSIYTTTFTAADGEKYSLHFQTATVMGSTGYRIAALTRYQSIEIGNGYTVEVSNIIYTEASNYDVGDLYMPDITLYKNGEALTQSNIFGSNNSYTYVVQEGDAATYYYINLTEEGGAFGEDSIPTYVKAEMTTDTAKTYKSDVHEKISVDISNTTGKVLVVRLVNEDVYAVNSTYDETIKIYTVEKADGKCIYVKLLDEGKVDVKGDIADFAN